ncbi:MAG: hypothetical protein K5644_04465, partial [Lachnospiraceae bacterium]|nr:hypothetical protein [Lachnospiraceae bacterium]
MGILKRKELGLFKWKVYRRKDDDEIKEELEVIARDCIDDVIDEIEDVFLKRNGCRVIKGIDRNKQVIIKSIDVLKDRGDHVGEVIAEFATTDSGSDEDISLGISIPIGFRFYIDTVGKTG